MSLLSIEKVSSMTYLEILRLLDEREVTNRFDANNIVALELSPEEFDFSDLKLAEASSLIERDWNGCNTVIKRKTKNCIKLFHKTKTEQIYSKVFLLE